LIIRHGDINLEMSGCTLISGLVLQDITQPERGRFESPVPSGTTVFKTVIVSVLSLYHQN